MDAALAYEQNAVRYMGVRDQSRIGAGVVRRWARTVQPGADILEIACGAGYPVTKELLAAGLQVWAIDGSQTLLSKFRARFPDVPVQCERVQDSPLYARPFDGVIAIGLIFLLPESEQAALIARISAALRPKGRLLFTAPIETGSWRDITTGIECVSLGRARYEQFLEHSGVRILASHVDEGKNHYYDAQRLEMEKIHVVGEDGATESRSQGYDATHFR